MKSSLQDIASMAMAMNFTSDSWWQVQNTTTSINFNQSSPELLYPGLRNLINVVSSPKVQQGDDQSLLAVLIIFTMPFMVPVFLHYAFTLAVFYWQRLHEKPGQVPPSFPHYLPFIGDTVRFLFDGPSLVKQATTFRGKQTAVAIALPMEKLFFFQGAKNVSAAWREKNLASPIYAYTIGLKHFFGMKDNALKTYKEDNSGPFKAPHPSSDVEPRNRLDYLSHQVIYKGLSGPGMEPAFNRFTSQVFCEFRKESIGEEWQQQDDLMEFYQDRLGPAMVRALYGPSLLAQNPGFMKDFWHYNRIVPILAKRVPRIFQPKAYAVRDKLVAQIKNWHQYSRLNFRETDVEADGDADPYWGCRMMRERQEILLGADRQDFDSVASTDLGLVWTTITNVVPSSMLACLELFNDASLLARARESVLSAIESREPLRLDMKKLESNQLLLSVYAETLRLHTQAYIARCSPHSNTHINGWKLPRNQIGVVSTYPAHNDTNVWNTKDGRYPLNSFWADRFLIYPDDPTSGPLSSEAREALLNSNKTLDGGTTDGPYFSMQGLDGSWIPYGGGHGICPGRNFAKRAIILTCAMMVTSFDIEFSNLNLPMEMDMSGFGLGVQKPKNRTPFKIRQRKE